MDEGSKGSGGADCNQESPRFHLVILKDLEDYKKFVCETSLINHRKRATTLGIGYSGYDIDVCSMKRPLTKIVVTVEDMNVSNTLFGITNAHLKVRLYPEAFTNSVPVRKPTEHTHTIFYNEIHDPSCSVLLSDEVKKHFGLEPKYLMSDKALELLFG